MRSQRACGRSRSSRPPPRRSTGTTSTRASTSRSSASARSSRARRRRRSASAHTSRRRSAAPTRDAISPDAVREVVHKLLDLGVDEISIGDTIGVATPAGVYEVVEALYDSGVTRGVLALHFHDTRGTALANVYAGLAMRRRRSSTPRRGPGRLPVRARARRQPRDGGPPLHARRPRHRDRGLSPGRRRGVAHARRSPGRRLPGRYLSAVWEDPR